MQKMQIKDILSPIDAQRLDEIGIGISIERAESQILTQLKQGILKLVEPTSDGSVPDGCIVSSKSFRESQLGKAYFEYKNKRFFEKYKRVKVSPALSDYLWLSEEGDDQIEFRSPVPDFPPPGQLTAVRSSNERRMKGVGEYCLAACDDGIVRWLHESECVNKRNHVWTVHLFDLRSGGAVYFGDRLQQPAPNVCINVVNNFVNKIVGGNVNWSGTQNIASVNCG